MTYTEKIKELQNIYGVTKEQFDKIQSKLFKDLWDNEPKGIIPFLLGKYIKTKGYVGDLVRDVLNDKTLSDAPYGISPYTFFNYISAQCDDYFLKVFR